MNPIRVGAALAVTVAPLAAIAVFAGNYATALAGGAGGMLASDRPLVWVTATDCYGGGVGLASTRRRIGHPPDVRAFRPFRTAPQSSLSSQNGCPAALSTQANPRNFVVVPR